MRAAAAFLIDATYGAATASTLVRMVGRYFFASGIAPNARMVMVSLLSSYGETATARVERTSLEVERTGFGEFLTFGLDRADSLVDFGEFDNDGPDGLPNSGDDDGVVDFL